MIHKLQSEHLGSQVLLHPATELRDRLESGGHLFIPRPVDSQDLQVHGTCSCESEQTIQA